MMLYKFSGFLYFSLLLNLLISCTSDDYVPKQKAYPRLILPENIQYTSASLAGCSYDFEYPTHSVIEIDSFFFGEATYDKCWINIAYPSLNSKIHISYKEIGKDISLEKVLQDAHEMTYNHSKKADFIDELNIKNKYGVEGLLFEVGGDAATNIQFYLSDFEKNYVRGALYFQATPNADSLQPAVDFVKADLMHFFETFQWK
jgi:gliding motility-associated lipoprotein GldD